MRLIGNSRMWLLVSNGRYMMRLIGLLLCVTSGWAQLPMFTQLLPFKIQDNAGSMYCSAPTNAMRATCTSKVCSPASSCFDITKVYDNNPSTAYNPPTITTYQFDFYFPQPVQANSFYVTTSGATTQDRPSWTFTASNSTTATYQSVGAFTLTVGTTPKIVNFSTTITASLWRVVATGAGSLQLYIPEMWFYTATCPAGYNAGNGSACTPCNTGTYNPGYTKCVACGSGTYSTGVGGSACTSCPSGTWATAWGLTSSQGCGLCGSGAYMLDAMNCTYCPGGTYSSTAGSACSLCGAGLYSDIGASVCSLCAAGYYSNQAGATACTLCPANSNSNPGASGCWPNQGYFDLAQYGLHRRFTYNSFNPATRVWGDLSPYGVSGYTNHSGASNYSVTTQCVPGDGAAAPVCYLKGNTVSTSPVDTDLVVFGTVPSSFTICSVTRFAGYYTNRVLYEVGSSYTVSDWVHGHTGGTTCLAYYGFNKNPSSSNCVTPITNWVAMCGQNSATGVIYVNGVSQTVSVQGGNVPIKLGINYQLDSDQSSFGVMEVVVWNYSLTASMVQQVNQIYTNMLSGSVAQNQYMLNVQCGGTCGANLTLHCMNNGTSVCCGAGTYFQDGVSTDCTICSAGSYSVNGPTACLACSPGQYSSAIGASVCGLCTAGYYNPNYADVTCYPCGIGYYSSGSAASVCTQCANGSYASETMFITQAASRYLQLYNIDTGTMYLQIGNGTTGYADGIGVNSMWTNPVSIISKTFDGSQYLVVDTTQKLVRNVDIFTRKTTTVIGLYNTMTNTNGIGTLARLGTPSYGLISPDKKIILIPDQSRKQIMQVNTSNLYTANIVGVYTSGAILNGIGTNAKLITPFSLCADSSFTMIYMFDSGYFRGLNMLTYNLSTITGTGNMTFEPLGANFGIIYAMYMMPDQQRILYTDTNVLRTINIATLAVNTVVGTGVSASIDGIGTNAQLKIPRSICASTMDPNIIFITQTGTYVRKININTWTVTSLPSTYTTSIMYITMLPFSFATTCIACVSGKYGTDPGATAALTCQLCQAGTYNSLTGDSACDICGIGTYSTGGVTVCTLCVAGTYNSNISLSTCIQCSPGQYTSAAGSSVCGLCTPGYYNPNYGDNTCYPCSIGYYSSGIAASSCTQCQQGGYAGETMIISQNTARTIQIYNIDNGNMILQIGNGTSGYADGVGLNTMWTAPGAAIPTTFDGSTYLTADTSARLMRMINLFTLSVTTSIGAFNTQGSTNGIGTIARLGFVQTGIASSDRKTVLLSDTTRRQILQVDLPSLNTRNIIGIYTLVGITDGVGGNAKITSPYSFCPDSNFIMIYMFDSGYFRVLNMSASNITTLAGSGNQTFEPNGVNFGIVYGMIMMSDQQRIAYTDNNVIRTINITSFAVQTVVGNGISASTDGIGTNAQLKLPRGISASTSDPTICFLLQSTAQVRKINMVTWAVTTLPTITVSATMYLTVIPFSFATACTVCSAGAYGDIAGATSAGTCQQCQAGSFAANGSSACTLCGVGFYTAANGSSSCLICGTGSYSLANGSTACSNCSAGSYQSASGASQCFNCGAGYYSPTTGGSVCIACSTGAFASLNSSTTCLNCSAGSYQNISGATSCIACGPGTFSNYAGASVCTACATGAYQLNNGSSTCTTCGVGTYFTGVVPSVCSTGVLTWLFKNPTNGFYYINLPQSEPFTFYVGGYNNNPSTVSYTKVRINSTLTYTPSNIQLYNSYVSGQGYTVNPGYYCGSNTVDNTYALTGGPTLPISMEFGEMHSRDKTVGDTIDFRGTPFSIADTILFSPTVCSIGGGCGRSVGMTCSNNVQLCSATVYCSPGDYFFKGILSIYNYTNYQSDLYTACALNKTDPLLGCDRTEILCSQPCSACSTGTYSSIIGVSTCVQCDIGKFSAIASSSTCNPCSAGSYQSAGGASQCLNCGAGYYSPTTGGSVCIACSIGAFAGLNGSSNCLNCSAGSYQSASGVSQCLNCGTGSYTSNTGGSVCIACIAGTFASTTGMTSCTGCYAGSYGTISGWDGGVPGNLTWLFFNASTGYYYVNLPGSNTCQRNFNGALSVQTFTKARIYSMLQASMQTVQMYVQYTGNSLYPCSATTSYDTTYATYPLTSANGIDIASAFSCSQYLATTQFSLAGTPFSVPNWASSWVNGAPSCSAAITSSVSCSTVQTCTITIKGNCAWMYWKGLLTVYNTAAFQTDIQAACVAYGGSQQLNCSGTDSLRCNICPVGTYSSAVGATQPCALCNAGTYQSSIGGSGCVSCGVGTYASIQGGSVCTICTTGSFNSGTGGNSTCSLCGTGTYQTGVASANCTLCGASTYQTGTGMISPLNCLTCSSGSYSTAIGASACLSCPANSWCASGVQNTCPLNSNSPVNSTLQNQCLCNQGYWGNGALVGTSPCALCLAGRYCPGGNNNLTIACPGNSTSPSGSYQITQCACLPGFYGLNGTNCTLCPANSYCASGVLNPCQGNSSSPTQSNNASSCACNAGFFGGSSCYECPMAYYCSGGVSITKCTPNATTASTMSISYLQCFCDRGFAGINNSVCYPCPIGSWCWTGVVNTCPPNSLSPLYSNYMYNCSCNVGYYGPGGGPCILCNQGTYNTLQGASSCLGCGSGLYSTFYGGINCSICDAGTYQTGIGLTASSDCTLCPMGTYQTGIQMGYYQNCTQCSNGLYATGLGLVDPSGCMTCLSNSYCNRGYLNSCPVNTVGSSGLSYQSQCQCLPGYSCVGLKNVMINITTLQTASQSSIDNIVSALSGMLGANGLLN